jgi:hypothetical protein
MLLVNFSALARMIGMLPDGQGQRAWRISGKVALARALKQSRNLT